MFPLPFCFLSLCTTYERPFLSLIEISFLPSPVSFPPLVVTFDFLSLLVLRRDSFGVRFRRLCRCTNLCLCVCLTTRFYWATRRCFFAFVRRICASVRRRFLGILISQFVFLFLGKGFFLRLSLLIHSHTLCRIELQNPTGTRREDPVACVNDLEGKEVSSLDSFPLMRLLTFGTIAQNRKMVCFFRYIL